MEQIAIYLFKPAAIVMAFLGLSFLVMSILRGRRLPQCFSCGAMKVRPSRPCGLLDFAGAFFLIRPHRCAGCRVRFYAMCLPGAPARPRRALKVVFRFRNGIPDRVAIRFIDLDPHTQPANEKPGSISGSPAALQT